MSLLGTAAVLGIVLFISFLFLYILNFLLLWANSQGILNTSGFDFSFTDVVLVSILMVIILYGEDVVDRLRNIATLLQEERADKD